MIRWVGLVLLLVSAVFAETQQEAYYRAMKAEEAGDISAALKAFEEAVVLPGPYTEELQGIIRDYKDALGIKGDAVASSEKSLEFHVAGELGLYGLHYKETGMDEGEMGGEIYLEVNPYVEYTSGAWSHTFAASVQGNYFLNNDNMSVLDTSDWNLSLGLEYTLMLHSFYLNVGYDFNIKGDELSSDFCAWAEKELFSFEKQRVGVAAWGFYQTLGRRLAALYASWHRTVLEGLNGTVYAGVKYAADSIYDYQSYFHSYRALIEDSSGTLEEPVLTQSLEMWLGPSLSSRISYKFSNRLALEMNLNMFYGIAVGGPDSDYKKIKKFNAVYGGKVSWKYWKIDYYLAVERIYKRLSMPESYKKYYSERSAFTKIKLGAKWDI